MGLTITYTLQTMQHELTCPRELVRELHQRARRLPFKTVDALIELTSPDGLGRPCDASHRAIMNIASRYLSLGKETYQVFPVHLVAFSTYPGPGCDTAIFGLCRYPRKINLPDKDDRATRVIDTGLAGWSWSGFCKTIYASKRECGGPANFLKCHMTVIQLLDEARLLGFAVDVFDPSGYWQERRPQSLLAAAGTWMPRLARFLAKRDGLDHESLLRQVVLYPAIAGLEGAY